VFYGSNSNTNPVAVWCHPLILPTTISSFRLHARATYPHLRKPPKHVEFATRRFPTGRNTRSSPPLARRHGPHPPALMLTSTGPSSQRDKTRAVSPPGGWAETLDPPASPAPIVYYWAAPPARARRSAATDTTRPAGLRSGWRSAGGLRTPPWHFSRSPL
jgi:hypothetical protein